MRTNELQHFKSRLLEMQGRLRAGIGRMIEAVVEDERPPGEHERTNVPTDEIGKEIALENAEEGIHRAIAAALIRIEKGSYGRCQRCGAGIERERLDALPYAESCIRCAQRHLESVG